MQSFRNLWKQCVSCLTLLTVGATLAWAQNTPPPPPAEGPTISSGRTWYFEGLIVIVMFGLALFVVCRSSRRN
ncbi:MAG: hypothetical protein KDA93_08120 [Planctomycetaceae bacterium]|nr:hypothetical protein [Planctomycetaceae bacterium]